MTSRMVFVLVGSSILCVAVLTVAAFSVIDIVESTFIEQTHQHLKSTYSSKYRAMDFCFSDENRECTAARRANVLDNRTGLGVTGEVYLIDLDGLPISESRFLEADDFLQHPLDGYQYPGEIITSHKGYSNARSEIATGYMNDLVLRQVGLLENAPYLVVVEQSYAEATAPLAGVVTRIYQLLAGLSALGVMVIVLTVTAYNRRVQTNRELSYQAARLERYNQRLAIFQHVFDESPVGQMVGQDNRVVLVNDELCKTLGFTRDELINRPIEDIIPPAFLDRTSHDHIYFDELERRLIDRRFESSIGVQAPNIDGRIPIKLLVSKVPLPEPNKVFNVAYLVDVTELVKAKNELEKAQKMYSQFVQRQTG